MDSTFILLSYPLHPSETDHDEDVVCSNEEDYKRLCDEYKRLRTCLKEFGFKSAGDGLYLDAEWCNGGGKLRADVFTISDANITALEKRTSEIRQLREQAASKLTDEELAALGVFQNEGKHCSKCFKRQYRKENIKWEKEMREKMKEKENKEQK